MNENDISMLVDRAVKTDNSARLGSTHHGLMS